MAQESGIHAPHQPVLLTQMLRAVEPADGETYIDGTFGAGGYSQALLDAADCRVVALDRDPSVRQFAEALEVRYPARFRFLSGRFSEMARLCREEAPVSGIVLDVGVSSMQLDQPERGFSFRYDGKLDMRMSDEGGSAAELLAVIPQTELADLLWRYGEEKASRRIAAAIVKARQETPITTTGQLRDIIHQVIPRRANQAIDPATRSFQALRIAVNAELEELESALQAAELLLGEGGRLVVVSFHSLEDRIVKQFLSAASARQSGASRHHPGSIQATQPPPTFTLPRKKVYQATDEDVAANPRARSARLRVAVRTGATPRFQPVMGECHA